MLKILGALVALAVAAGLLVLGWPQLFGLQTTWIIAQAVAMRGLLVGGSLIAVLVFLGLAAVRPIRALAGSIAGLLLVFSVANGAILADRGLGGGAPRDGGDDQVTVLSWNTLGDAPGAQAVAELAVRVKADVVTLPETTEDAGVRIAETMRALGRPMWVHTTAYDDYLAARSTTVLVNPALGDYHMVTAGTEREQNTKVLPSVILQPASGTGPTIIAAHAVSPISGQMDNWRDDLRWLAEQCGSGSIIMAGDFNATLDSMSGLGVDGGTLGSCRDAALQSGDAAVGTWPAGIPPLAGAPIDHVMATSDWSVEDVHVLDEYDGAGSDHRPIVAHLRHSG